MTHSYMCPDCGERVDDTITVRGVFGEDESESFKKSNN